MNRYSILFVLLLCVLVDSYQKTRHHHHLRRSNKKQNTPPHCTQVTKDTDYQSRFKYDYPIAYIQPGQHEAYQQPAKLKCSHNSVDKTEVANENDCKLFCVNPATVNKAVTIVCDWAAPPQVQFTLGDEYMHVVRQDPTGRFLGNAVITTYQYCNHTLHNGTRSRSFVTVIAL